MLLKYRAGRQNQASRNSPPDPADPADPGDPPEMGGPAAVDSLPSTRAGGQDDGSLTNSLKLEVLVGRFAVDRELVYIEAEHVGFPYVFGGN